jgi:hypothetical protein
MTTGNLIQAQTRSLTFYAAGGTAVNLLRAHRSDTPKHTDAMADEKYCFIDTSIANLRDVSEADTFVLEGTDGSGSDRPRNAKAVMEAMPAILNQFKPGDTNIVIFSAAGGTGSVAGPIILEELLKSKKKVFAIVIGTHGSLKATANTIATLTGLEMAVNRVGRSVVMAYRENDASKNNAGNNVVPMMIMEALSLLCSGKNNQLDGADIGNMIDYHTVTHHKPSLSMLDVYVNEEQLVKESTNPIVHIALLRNEEAITPAINPAYGKSGYLPMEAAERYKESFHFVVSNSRLKGVLSNLLKRREELESEQRVVERQTSLVGDGDVKVDQGTGLVF